jgi:hypothetical protein
MSKVPQLAMAARRAIIAMSMLLAGLALAAPVTPVAQAALDGCRSDPVIYLSDGTALDISADVSTSVSNVTSIAYFVHVPQGLHAILYLATPTLGFRGKETFVLLNDAPARQYQIDTLVGTRNGAVAVTAHTTLVGVYLLNLSLSLQAKAASGFSGADVWTTVYR